ncbi:MAG: hypothetical protein LAP85_11490 [Acidobacteriia bacterium]|nr:hypothetical protein [Terriglobia bacterium]
MYRYGVVLSLLVLAVPLYAQSDLAFPQIALGGNPAYETLVQVINEVENTNPVVIEVYQGSLAGTNNGTPLPVKFDGGTPASSLSATLGPFQEFTTLITGTSTTLMNGWIRVRSTLSGGKISASLLYRQRSGTTVIDSVGATSPQRYRLAVVQVDQREAGSDAGLAFVNPDTNSVDVTLSLYKATTLAVAPITVTLQPKQHYAKLISQMFPAFLNQQGTLVIEAAAGRTVPCMALRLDGLQNTNIPVRPLGFSFQYTITDAGGAAIETGYWLFDLAGFNLVGTGKVESPVAADLPEVSGSWVGTNFQFRYRRTFTDGSVGMVVFNGSSAGNESTTGSDGKSKALIGKVTIIAADGTVVATYNFTAFHKFGSPPQ